MISGDLNIVDVRMVVQYNISNLTDFLFRVNDPGEPARNIDQGEPDGRTLKDASEAALRLVVGKRSIDDVTPPPLVRANQHLSDRPRGLAPTFLSLRTHRESFLPVESLNPLPVHQPAFSSKHHMDHPIAPARPLLRQLYDASS